MSYPYFKFLISRYNEYSARYGTGEIISLKHTFKRDPLQVLRRTQKIEWTKFLQTLFDWFSSSNVNLQRGSDMEIALDYETGTSGNNEITSDAFEPLEQGMKKITNAYTMFYNRFKKFIITFVESLPTENLKFFIKNLTFYSGGDIRSSLLSNIGGNIASGGLNIEEKHQFLQDVFTLCIKSFYQTGKLPVSGEKHLDVGDIQLPPDTKNFPDTIRLYFQYNNNYLLQSIVSIQAIAMWLYAFNSQHRELVRATMQEYFMNLTYESLRYPKITCDFI